MANTVKPEAVASKLKRLTAKEQQEARAIVYAHYYSAFANEQLQALEPIPAESGSRIGLRHKIPNIQKKVEDDPSDFGSRMSFILAVVKNEDNGIEIDNIEANYEIRTNSIHKILSTIDSVQLQAIAESVGAETDRFGVVEAIELKLDRGWASIPKDLRPKVSTTAGKDARKIMNMCAAESGIRTLQHAGLLQATENTILEQVANTNVSHGRTFDSNFDDVTNELGFECTVADLFPKGKTWNNLLNAGVANKDRRLAYQAILETYLVLNTKPDEVPVRKVLGVFPFEIETEGPGTENFDDIIGASERAREWLKHVSTAIVPKMGALAVTYTENLMSVFADRDTQVRDIQSPSKHAPSKYGARENASLVDTFSKIDFAVLSDKLVDVSLDLVVNGPMERVFAQITDLDQDQFLALMARIEQARNAAESRLEGGAA